MKISRRALSSGDDESRVKILLQLVGVGIPVASAILTSYNPEEYGH